MDKIFCPLCGKQSFDGEEFCLICGAPLDKAVAASASVQTVSPPPVQTAPAAPESNKKKLWLIAIPVALLLLLAVAVGIIVAHTSNSTPSDTGDVYADDGYVDDGYVDNGYVDDGYVDDSYVDDSYVDDSYVDDSYVDDSSSYYPSVTGYTYQKLSAAIDKCFLEDDDKATVGYLLPGFEQIIGRIESIDAMEGSCVSDYTTLYSYFDSEENFDFNGLGIHYYTTDETCLPDEIDGTVSPITTEEQQTAIDTVEQVFYEYYGDNMTINCITILEAETLFEHHFYIYYTFIIETDTGCFFLFDY